MPSLEMAYPSQSPFFSYFQSVLNSCEVQVIDATALNLSDRQILAKIENFSPHVIGITTNILTSAKSVTLANLIKSSHSDIPVILGGPWATVEYESLLRKKTADFIIIGEGEIAFEQFILTFQTDKNYQSIAGLAFLNGNEQILLKKSEKIQNLDAVPLPAWHLFPPPSRYFFNTRKKTVYPIMTSRGCPFDCNHCTKVIHGSRVRFRNVTSVLAEIKQLKSDYGLEELLIIDDNFNVNKKRAADILQGIIEQKLNIYINFSNGIRADTLSDDFLKKLKQAGAYKLAIGVESGNQEVVKMIGKNLNLELVEKAARKIRKLNFIFNAYFMIGHPFDTKATIEDTINFSLKINPDYPHFFKAIAFPGTLLYEQVCQKGRFINNNRNLDRGYHNSAAFFETQELKARDISYYYKMAYRKFYMRPEKILSLLLKIKTWHEFTYFLNFAVIKLLDNIREIISITNLKQRKQQEPEHR